MPQAQYLPFGLERLDRITISDAKPNITLMAIFIVIVTTNGLSEGCALGR